MPSSNPTTNPPPANDAAARSALLIIDMLSSWDFPDAERLLPPAAAIAPCIAALAARCREAGVPVIYANDNHGRWRSDLSQVVDAALAGDGQGAVIARQLRPQPSDYFVLKPKHSCFHATPLNLLLRHLGATRLVLCGVSSDQCVLYTAADARMRDYEVVVPRDCVATQSDERHKQALRHFAQALDLQTPPWREIDLAGEQPEQREQTQQPEQQ